MEKKTYGFWDSLREHPIRTIVIVSLLCDAAVALFKSND